jgi:MFS family permease
MVSARRDPWLICASALCRSMAAGILGVVLAIFLAQRGLSVSAIGLVMGAGIAGAALLTALLSPIEARVGRRQALIGFALLATIGCLAPIVWTRLAPLVVFAFAGMLNGMGRDRGPAGALEQATLPNTVDATQRTWILAWYNLVLDGGHAFGALTGALPAILASRLALSNDEAHRATLIVCAALVAISAVPYLFLSPVAIGTSRLRDAPPRPVPPETRRVVTRIALLFGLDSLGGGFLSSALIAFWFFERYGLREQQIAALFFAARLLNAGSHLAAAWLARRIGLLNTMVFTHLPSSVFLMAAPAGATATVAGGLFLAREALVEMDVPTRQSYVMAIVPPEQRAFASGVTNATRTVAWALGPAIAGFVMQHVVLAGPLFIGGTLKIAYDVLLYGSFRRIKPPEEQQASRA